MEKLPINILKNALRNYSCEGPHEVYDTGGILLLLRTCLSNLKENDKCINWDELTDLFTNEQKKYLTEMLNILKS